MIAAGVDFCTSVPCNTLSALIDTLDRTPAIRHVAVTREEEGVGICAGAALNGRLPVLLMQNSGLGNCLNAILSLTKLYELPLVLLTSYRGGPDEKIVAQLPMGQAMRPLLAAIDVPFAELTAPGDVDQIGQLARRAAEGRVVAGILHSSFWGAA
jgi:sulfopyruvate decarboxylase subunit alpha